jgi:transcriptional regulator with XRE-family HTH domain
MGTAAQIRGFRVRAGKSKAEMAEQVGLNPAWYDDLERHDHELVSTLTLFQAMNLAAILDVRLDELLLSGSPSPEQHISLLSLPDRIRAHVARQGISIKQFGDKIGWELSEFIDSPVKGAAELPIQFLRDLAIQLGIDWLCIVPTENTA